MLLRMQGIDLAYGEAPALRSAGLEVVAGEVHALLGENGAGKSSLMKVLAGAVTPQGGTVALAGQPLPGGDPGAAQAAGVAMIWQELTLLPHLTVAENLQLGREGGLLRRIDRRVRAAAVARALALVQRTDLDPAARVATLSPADRQMVEIARAVARDARVLVMDEPTSSLGRDDVQRLFAVIGQLRQQGLGIVYISHFLDEVRRVADRFTVLRDGATVATGRLVDTTDADLVRHMAGRSVDELFPPAGRTAGSVALTVRDLAAAPLPQRSSFELHRGEILGIGGLAGAGRTELLEAIFGLRPRRAGTVTFAPPVAGVTPAALWRTGVGFVAEDRKLVGLGLQRPIADNLVLPSAGPWWRPLPPRAVAATATRWIERLRIRCRGPWQRCGLLSGGNQQKVALARLLQASAAVLLLDEPTRGVDVGARQEIYALLDQLARQGAAILLVSSQLPELLGLCDRIAVMTRGVLGPARPTAAWTQESLLQAALALEVA